MRSAFKFTVEKTLGTGRYFEFASLDLGLGNYSSPRRDVAYIKGYIGYMIKNGKLIFTYYIPSGTGTFSVEIFQEDLQQICLILSN